MVSAFCSQCVCYFLSAQNYRVITPAPLITNHLPPLKHRISLRELDTEAMKPAEIFPLSQAARKVKSLRELSGDKSGEGGGRVFARSLLQSQRNMQQVDITQC